MKKGWEILFNLGTSVVLANSTAETTLISPNRGSLSLAPLYFTPGKILRIRGRGLHSVTGTPTFNIKLKLDSTAILTTGAISIGTGANQKFELEGLITCQAQGSSNTLMAQGTYTEPPATFGNVSGIDLGNTAAASIDTTAAHVLDLTGTWSAASSSNTLTLTNLVIEQSDGN